MAFFVTIEKAMHKSAAMAASVPVVTKKSSFRDEPMADKSVLSLPETKEAKATVPDISKML